MKLHAALWVLLGGLHHPASIAGLFHPDLLVLLVAMLAEPDEVRGMRSCHHIGLVQALHLELSNGLGARQGHAHVDRQVLLEVCLPS